MSQRFAIAWLVIAIQIAGTWSLTHFAPPSIDTGVEVIIPGLHDCEADAEGRIDYDCMKRRTQFVEDYLAEHDIPGADQRHGPIVWIEALIALICGGVVFTFSQSRLSAAFASLIYLIAFAAAALGPPTLVGLLVAIALVWIGRRARHGKMAP